MVQVMSSWSEWKVVSGVCVLISVCEVPALISDSTIRARHKVFYFLYKSFVFGSWLFLAPMTVRSHALLTIIFTTAPGTDLVMIEIKSSVSNFTL